MHVIGPSSLCVVDSSAGVDNPASRRAESEKLVEVMSLPERVEVHMRDSDAFLLVHGEGPAAALDGLCASCSWMAARTGIGCRNGSNAARGCPPGFRHRVVLPPLRLAHAPLGRRSRFRPVVARFGRFRGGTPEDAWRTVLEFRSQDRHGRASIVIGRCGSFTFIEGLDGGQTALVDESSHHSLTGRPWVAWTLRDCCSTSNPTPACSDRCPKRRWEEHLGTVETGPGCASATTGRKLFDFSKRPTSPRRSADVTARAAASPRKPSTETVADRPSDRGASLHPCPDTLSPVITERHLAWHYDVLKFPLADMLKRRARPWAPRTTMPSSPVSRQDCGLLPRNGTTTQIDELRVTMPVSIRKADDPIGGKPHPRS